MSRMNITTQTTTVSSAAITRTIITIIIITTKILLETAVVARRKTATMLATSINLKTLPLQNLHSCRKSCLKSPFKTSSKEPSSQITPNRTSPKFDASLAFPTQFFGMQSHCRKSRRLCVLQTIAECIPWFQAAEARVYFRDPTTGDLF